MKLTIGMIVKNEEKWLDKCLSAIKPVLDSVDSELIITDTGSTDRTVEIAKKYTDKVLHFEWCDDFSAARNTALDIAKGEWFMFLDADEIFEDCSGIIDFFNSGEFGNYNSASFIIRNLSKTEEGTSYSDIYSPRLTRIFPETVFENPIHEVMITFRPPYKNIGDIAVHYGYLFENDDDRIRKSKRNAELLKNRLNTDKDPDPIMYVQLYEAYIGMNDEERALRFINKGIDLCKKKNSIVLVPLYFHKASFLQSRKKYKGSIEVCEEYFGMSPAIRPHRLNTDCEIYGIKALCLYESGQYSEAIENFEKYFDTLRAISENKINTYDRFLTSRYLSNDINVLPVFNKLIDCCIRSDKFNTADMYLCGFPIEKYTFEERITSELVKMMLCVSGNTNYRNTKKYYEQLDIYGKKVLSDELFFRLQTGDEREPVMSALREIAASDEKIKLKLSIYSSTDPTDKLDAYVREYGVNNDVDLIYIALRDKCDISALLRSPEIDLKKCAYICCRNIEGFYEAAEDYPADSIKDNDVLDDAARFYEYCIAARLLDNEDKTSEEKKNYISRLFKVKCDILARKNDNLSEFEKLAVGIKNNIRKLIANGDIASAKKNLDEYKKLNPNDKEISDLLYMTEKR